jgi:hypothetical protein
MDPVSALTVAAAAVQFLDLESYIFINARELHKSSYGHSQKNIKLEEVIGLIIIWRDLFIDFRYSFALKVS